MTYVMKFMSWFLWDAGRRTASGAPENLLLCVLKPFLAIKKGHAEACPFGIGNAALLGHIRLAYFIYVSIIV